jgi:hypothetical protein
VRCGLGLCGGAGAGAGAALTCDDDDDCTGAGGERPQPERASISVAAPNATATPKCRRRLDSALTGSTLTGSADASSRSEISHLGFIYLPVLWPEQRGPKKVGVERFDC